VSTYSGPPPPLASIARYNRKPEPGAHTRSPTRRPASSPHRSRAWAHQRPRAPLRRHRWRSQRRLCLRGRRLLPGEGQRRRGFRGHLGCHRRRPSQTGVDPPPYTWAITSGSLPAGLTFNDEYVDEVFLSGTPTKAGTSSFTLQVTDSAGGGSVSQAFTIAIGTGNLDQVVITKALYYKNHSYQQKLQIIASDANTSATLTAYVTSTGQQIGLPEVGGFGDTFSGTFGGAFAGSNPSTITIKSSLGGTATSPVTVCPGTEYC